MSAAFFTSLLVTIIFEIAYTFQWWVIFEQLAPWGHITNVSLVYGAFLVGSIWILYLTYGKFWLFLLTNLVVDGLFMFGISRFFEGKLYDLVNISRTEVFVLMLGFSILMYGYQASLEGI